MSRSLPYAILLLLPWAASANLLMETNEVTSLTNAVPISVDKAQAVRATIYARIGSLSLPLNLATNYTVVWEWKSEVDAEPVYSSPGRIRNGSAGHVVVTAALHNIDAGVYIAESWAVQGTQRSHRLSWHLATVTSSVAAAGVSIDLAGVQIAGSNLLAVGVNSGLVVTAQGDGSVAWREVAGGGGYLLNIYTNGALIGAATNGISIDGTMSGFLSNGIFFVGFNVGSPIPTNLIGSNRVTFSYTGSTQTFAVPSGITNIRVLAWGGATFANSPGGFTDAILPVTPFENLQVVVGQGGQGSTGRVSSGVWVSERAFPGGGRGVAGSANANGSSGGAGGTYLLRNDTNILVVAGGAGGIGSAATGAAFTGGNGGGEVGGEGSGSVGGIAGTGGTQSSGGATPGSPSYVNWVWTNTAGSFRSGGDGGVTNTTDTVGSGGGGDGYYGGGGGSAPIFTRGAGGGAGSGYVNPLFTVWGITLRQTAGVNTPVGSELDEYPSGVGVSLTSIGAVLPIWSNPGGLVIVY